MTTVAPTTGELFQRALELTRAFPIVPPDRPPAFELPRSPLAARVAGEGAIAGPRGDMWATSRRLAAGEVSVADVVAACVARIAAHASRLHAFEHVAGIDEAASELAHAAERGEWRGPLHGMPISVKDIIDVAGMPTTGSSAALPPRAPSEDATAVARLRAAGALIIGKTVTHEFALGVTTAQSRSPWDETRVPGGSSGGSAISVTTGMALATLGTDTRASIRVPAALSGLVGYRPSAGLVPRDRWMTLSWSMDELAPMARSVRDIALLIDVLSDRGDHFRSRLPATLDGARIATTGAFVRDAGAGVRARFDAALAAIERGGGIVVRQDEPTADDMELANAAGMIVSRAEAAHYHREAGTDLARCSAEVRSQLQEAATLEAIDYVRCLRLRHQLHERFMAALANADLLIMPTSKVVAPPRETADQYLLVLSENCVPWSFAGFPAISIHAGMADGLPVGVQLVAKPGHDASLIALAYAIERLLPEVPAWRPR